MKIETEILAKNIVNILIDKKMIISTIESCTGGGLSNAITNIPGASNIIKEAFVTYSNESKVNNVGVDNTLINKYGVVSKEVAIDMAKKLKDKAKCDIAISTTGNLGPDALEDKDVGLVYIGYAMKDKIDAIECRFKGDRIAIKTKVIEKALDIIYSLLVK